MDSAVGMKKKRLAALQANNKAKEKEAAAQKKEKAKAPGGGMGMFSIADCDLGASPQMSKGAIYNKKQGGGGKESPLYQAAQYKLGRRH